MTRGVAIITGASSGIGRALAERAVRAGWRVFAVGRRADRLDELAARLAGATGSLATLALDLRTPHAAQRIVQATLERFGGIDVLVNNAGGVAVGPISEQSDDALDEQVQTHIVVPLALTREALPSLRATRGHIFFVGSGVARIPVGTLGAYPPAKAAVRNLTRIVRNDLRGDGIAVTYVDPGAVASEFMTRVGFAGPPPAIAASPYAVARKIFAAFNTRVAVVNAVPWQTFFVAVGEALPGVTDFILRRAPQLVGGDAVPAARALPAASARPAANALPGASAPPPASAIPGRSQREPAAASPEQLAAPWDARAESLSTRSAKARSEPTPLRPEGPASSSAPSPAVTQAPATPARDAEKPPLGASPTEGDSASPLEVALAEQRSRMRKLNLTTSFIRSILVPGDDLEPSDVAMRWAGMPNKNERGLTDAVLAALAAAGYLERIEADRYRVLRGDPQN